MLMLRALIDSRYESHHGTLLEQHSRLLNQIVKDVEPLKVLPDFLRTVVQDHERRITALEKPGA